MEIPKIGSIPGSQGFSIQQSNKPHTSACNWTATSLAWQTAYHAHNIITYSLKRLWYTDHQPLLSLIKGIMIVLHILASCWVVMSYHIAGKFGGDSICKSRWIRILLKTVWWINRMAQIVTTNMDDFSMVNRWWFAKFTKLSPTKHSHYTVTQVTALI